MLPGALRFLPLCLASGCALGPGTPYAVLEASFEAVLAAPPGRDLPDGWQRLNTDYQVRITSAQLELSGLELLTFGEGGVAFDPAHPPAGYGLCHNGHCHRDDGALISYEEISAELAGNGAGAPSVVTLPIGRRDLLVGGRETLECDPGCDLPRADISRARLRVMRIAMEGVVRDSRVPARLAGEPPWRMQASFSGVTQGDGTSAPMLTGELGAPADREHPPRIIMSVTLRASGALLDTVEWASLTANVGAFELSASSNSEAFLQVLSNLGETALDARVTRSPLSP
jgi:hypothetical protein